MIIEKATIKDLKEVQRLNKMLFDKEYAEYDRTLNLAWTIGELGTKYYSDSIRDDNACTFVAREGERIVGYLVGWIKHKQNPCRTIILQAELENMFILEEFRNKRIGSRLVEEFFKWAKDKDVDSLRVSASSQNDKAINFYRKCGFKDCAFVLEKNI